MSSELESLILEVQIMHSNGWINEGNLFLIKGLLWIYYVYT